MWPPPISRISPSCSGARRRIHDDPEIVMAERKRGDFSGLSQDYQRYRPDYPAEITAAGVAFLKAGGLACDSRLLAVDVGAGTGISTRAWRRTLGRVCRIVGIEPGEDMRREAIAATPAHQRIEYRVLLASSIGQQAVAAIGEERLLAAIRPAIDGAVAADGLVEFPYVAEIHLARKKECNPE